MSSLDRQPATGLDRQQHGPARGLEERVVSCGSRGTGPRWHCAWTKQGHEATAARSIAAAEFEPYLPLHLERDAWRNTTIGPLFRRYVFVRFDPTADNWGCIPNLRGVCGLIRHGYDLPTSLPDAAILELQARTSTRGIVDDPGESPWEAPGGGYRPVWTDMAGLGAGGRQRLLVRLFGASVGRREEDAA